MEKKADRWENSLSEAYENLSDEPKLELKAVAETSNQIEVGGVKTMLNDFAPPISGCNLIKPAYWQRSNTLR